MTAPKREDERCARFRALYEANYDVILGYALRRTLHADALDVVAETFTVAWRRLERVPGGDEARLWLYGTARRVLANHERAAQRRARLGGRIADEAARLPEALPERSQGTVAAAGRPGIAVAKDDDVNHVRSTLVFDPNTSVLLAEEESTLEGNSFGYPAGTRIELATYLQTAIVGSLGARP